MATDILGILTADPTRKYYYGHFEPFKEAKITRNNQKPSFNFASFHCLINDKTNINHE